MGFFRKNTTTNYLGEDAAALAEVARTQAERVGEWLAPHASKAAGEIARVAKDAQERLEPAYAEARTRVVEDYYPRAVRASEAAALAAQEPGTATERASRAVEAARIAIVEAPVPKKSRRVLKTLGWLTVAAAAGCAAYVVWQRSQPVEDPWAEEYWADSTEDAEFAAEETPEA